MTVTESVEQPDHNDSIPKAPAVPPRLKLDWTTDGAPAAIALDFDE